MLIACSLLVYPDALSAQCTGTDSRELFIYIDDTVDDDMVVNVTAVNLETSESDSWTFSRDNPHESYFPLNSTAVCQWTASTDNSGGSGDAVTFIGPNELFRIELSWGSEEWSFLYLNCEPTQANYDASDSFYCPFVGMNSSSPDNDARMLVSSQGLDFHQAQWWSGWETPQYKSLTDDNLTTDFMWPHDLAAFCDVQLIAVQSACRQSSKRANIFWTQQVGGHPFTHMEADLEILPGFEAVINATETLYMTSGTQIIVEGEINITGMTLAGVSPSGTWDGFVFQSGSSGSLSGVEITDATTGISAVGSSTTVDVTNSTIEGATIGLYYGSGATGFLQGNTIIASGAALLAQYAATPYLQDSGSTSGGDNQLDGDDYGIRAASGS
jgi:hypothetical protein